MAGTAELMLIGSAAAAPFLHRLLQTAGCPLDRGVALMILLTAGTMVFLPVALPRVIPGFAANPWEVARPLLTWLALPLVAGMAAQASRPAHRRARRTAAGKNE
jgi:hypothetical protein